MPRLLPIVLAGFTATLVSSPSHAQMNAAPGAQCRPAVANGGMYHNCRLRIVDGSEVCRCRIAPSAVTRNSIGEQSGRDGVAAGSIGRVGSGLAGVSQRSPAGIDGRSGVANSGSPAAGGMSAGPGAASGSNSPASSPGVSSREQDNAGIGNGWEGSDINDYGGAAAVAADGVNTSRGDPDNPAHGSGTSPGNSGSAGKSAEAPGRTR
jgi:hypothetical protein